MQSRTETKVEFYPKERKMKRAIRKMQRRGWEVMSVQSVDRGYGLLKTGILGLLFLPLALLGKKPKVWQVTYKRDVDG